MTLDELYADLDLVEDEDLLALLLDDLWRERKD